MENQIQAALKAAMIAKDQTALAALRAVKAAILLAKTSESGAKDSLSDAEIIKIITKLVKERKESAEIYINNGRQELADAELGEAEVMKQFLPAALSEAEIEAEVAKVIAAVGATSMKDMGKVMGMATKALAGKAEGGQISAIVKKLLS